MNAISLIIDWAHNAEDPQVLDLEKMKPPDWCLNFFNTLSAAVSLLDQKISHLSFHISKIESTKDNSTLKGEIFTPLSWEACNALLSALVGIL